MYLALYRKYRPQTFADVISQEHITTTLTNQLKNGQVAHAYLFTGSRGTGKTTCAKILAKAVNCTSLENGNPCLKCDMCRLVDEGVSDVLEIDAASNNGVDAVRALRDEAMYSPVSCKYRVYIIDEVHMLSTAAFNALLKLIEEPPSHVIFILATTEIHKVPATIISRCQRFEFRRIDIGDSAARLCDICMTEGAEISENAAYLIAKLSDGGMRDALSLLDQCISVSKHVTEDIVRECAGVAGSEHLFEIADCVAAQNTAQALFRLNSLIQSGKDISRLVEELIGHYRNLMLLKVNKGTEKLVSALPEDIALYEKQNASYTLPQIMRAITILGDCLDALSRNKQRGVTAEMCIIKLCSPKLDTDAATLSQRIDRLEQLINSGVSIGTANSAAPAAKPAEPIQHNSEIDSIISQATQGKPPVQTAPAEIKPQTAAKQPPEISAQATEALRKAAETPSPSMIPPATDAQTVNIVPQLADTQPPEIIPQAESVQAPEIIPQTESGQVPEIIPQADEPFRPIPAEPTDDDMPPLPPEPMFDGENDIIPEPIMPTASEAPPMQTTPQAIPTVPPTAQTAANGGAANSDSGATAPQASANGDNAATAKASADGGTENSSNGAAAQISANSDSNADNAELAPSVQPEGEFIQHGEVREWADIVDSLPFSICVLIGGTKAHYNGGEIIVEGTSVAKSFVSGEYNTQIRDAAEKALGRRYAIISAPDETEEQHDKVSELLALAEKQGITIKRK